MVGWRGGKGEGREEGEGDDGKGREKSEVDGEMMNGWGEVEGAAAIGHAAEGGRKMEG